MSEEAMEKGSSPTILPVEPAENPEILVRQLERELPKLRIGEVRDREQASRRLDAYLAQVLALAWNGVAAGDLERPEVLLNGLEGLRGMVYHYTMDYPKLSANFETTIGHLAFATDALSDRRAEARLLAEKGPSRLGQEVLFVLWNARQPLRRGEVLARLPTNLKKVTSPRVSQVLADLHAAGLVIRNIRPARGNAETGYYSLTPRAIELKDKIEKAGIEKAGIEKAGMTDEAKLKANQELKHLESMPVASVEAAASRNYVDWLISLPWTKVSRESFDLKRAQEMLDQGHYGLNRVKEQILEFFAVMNLTKKAPRSILCFVGPPGVGKSTLAKSIAKLTGRNFVRLSLAGLRDDAEIRGHRRTNIGASPGQIIQTMKKAGTLNPVFFLDRIDKISTDFRGDPAATLLEVLDPAQNDSFIDHFLDVKYDLSKVMFIASANVLHTIPAILLDRMEVIEFSSYAPDEKLAICLQFLVPWQVKANGLSDQRVTIGEDAIRVLINFYTHEAGVNNLGREIASICRKLARRLIDVGRDANLKVEGQKEVAELLGPPRFHRRPKVKDSMVGVSASVNWTEIGGEIFEIQISVIKGTGNWKLTGNRSDFLQGITRSAVSFVRSRGDIFNVDPDFLSRIDIQLQVPEGPIPKDGPSTGIAIATALVSALCKIPVQQDLAMTGEITASGKVLPVRWIKDKIIAAFQAEIFEIIIPRENEDDLQDISAEVRSQMTIHLVESMDEVIGISLDGRVNPPAEGTEKFDPSSPESVNSASVTN